VNPGPSGKDADACWPTLRCRINCPAGNASGSVEVGPEAYSQTAVAEQRESPLGNGFFDELHRLGYVEGRNLVIEQYSSEERAFRNPALARAVVERNPDAVVASTNPMCSISKPPRARSRLSVLRPIRWHSASCRILRGREATSRE
jgi:hypothetical protein